GAARATVGLQLGVGALVGFPGSTTAPQPGVYYNPQRSGQGFFLSQASGQQALDWYSYLEDGTPTWYAAQTNAPSTTIAFDAWSAPLFRAAWDGSAHTFKRVGDVILTPIANDRTVFSWHLDGIGGSEIYSQIGAGACPLVNGVATNLNGDWYAPTQSGYGMDVLALPDQEFDAFYFYDALGIPRWGLGQGAPFASNMTLDATQSSGFCPSCAYHAVTTQPLGTLIAQFSNGSTGNYATDFTLKTPMSGTWSVNVPITRLTGSPACTP
ncbi:MAG TPA: hypothetical protein VF132_05310, partial [Rudaea sp.]